MNNYIGLSEGQFLFCWPPSRITEKRAPLFFWNIKVQNYISEKESQKDVSSFATMGHYVTKQNTALDFTFSYIYFLPLESPFYLRIFSFLRLCSYVKRASGSDPGLPIWAISSKICS